MAKAGHEVLPTHTKDGRKNTPWTPHGYKDATTDPATLARWWAEKPLSGVGVRVPEGVLVVDVDVKKGKVGRATLAALETELGKLPRTKRHETPSGGWHLWFTVPVGVAWPAVAGKDVDLLHHGNRFAAVLSSDGEEYENDLDSPMVPLPAAWVAKLRVRKVAADADNTDRLLDMPGRAEVEACLAVLPADCSYAEWMPVIGALVHHYRGTVHEEWARGVSHDWSGGGVGYSEADVDRMWDTGFQGVGPKTTFGTLKQKASRVELKRLYPVVQAATDICQVEAAVQGNLVLTKSDMKTLRQRVPDELGGAVDIRKATEPGDGGKAEATGAEVFRDWYSCPSGPSFIRLVGGRAQSLTRAGFDQLYNHLFPKSSASSMADAVLIGGKVVDGVRYRPRAGRVVTDDDGTWLNVWTYQGPGVDMGPEGVAAMSAVEDAMCRFTGDLDEVENMMDFLALVVQGRRPMFWMGLIGPSQVGKTTLLHALITAIMGSQHVHHVDGADGKGMAYDDWLVGWREVTFVEEMTVGAGMGNKIKALNTGEPARLLLNVKGKPQVPDTLDTAVMFTGNDLPTMKDGGVKRRLYLPTCQWGTTREAKANRKWTVDTGNAFKALVTKYGQHLRWTLLARVVTLDRSAAPVTQAAEEADNSNDVNAIKRAISQAGDPFLPGDVALQLMTMHRMDERPQDVATVAREMGYRMVAVRGVRVYTKMAGGEVFKAWCTRAQ